MNHKIDINGKMITMFLQLNRLLLGLLILFLSSMAFADDLEILSSSESDKDANVLFIMDLSGSMDLRTDVRSGSGFLTRKQVLTEAIRNTFEDESFKGVNVGLTFFAGGGGGGVGKDLSLIHI